MNTVADYLDIPREDCISSLLIHPQEIAGEERQPYRIVLTSCPHELWRSPARKAYTTHTVVLADDVRDRDPGDNELVVLVNPRRKVPV